MKNYFKILMAKKEQLKKLQERFKELEDESVQVGKDLLQVQVQYTRVYHELQSLKQEPEIDRVETGAVLTDILFLMISVLLIVYLNNLGLDLFRIILAGLLSFGAGVLGTFGFAKWKKSKLLMLAEEKKENINEKEEELNNLEQQKENLREKLSLVSREKLRVRQEIDALLPEITNLEQLIDCYLAPYLSMYVDQAIDTQDKQVGTSLARIEKHLSE
ncbi:MAG: hypothetical protein K2J20_01755 [Bacilli bacterium]|nr:hypothetical protein [Bacilli bacterium]